MKKLKLFFMIIFVIVMIILIIRFIFIKFIKFDANTQIKMNNLFLKHSTNEPIIDCSEIGWAKIMRENYKVIYSEYKAFTEKYHSPALFKKQVGKPADIDVNEKWKTIILYMYGKKTEYAKYFPKTMKLLKGTPSTLAMFSVMDAGAVLIPHEGVYAGVLRYHLGLKIPKENKKCFLGIRNNTGKEIIKNWEDGKDIMFDDLYTHRVQNNTNESRVILFVDIKKKFNNFFVNLLNKIILYIFKHNYNKDFEVNKNVNTINNILKTNVT
jgi:ornithine lipid ester-linked acyl 2-hydroxylase